MSEGRFGGDGWGDRESPNRTYAIVAANGCHCKPTEDTPFPPITTNLPVYDQLLGGSLLVISEVPTQLKPNNAPSSKTETDWHP
jgi:hypothetical protein